MQKLIEVFTITSTLFENETTIIYRARRQADDLPVILKTYKRREDTHKIKHEYTLLKGRHIEGIANVIDIYNDNEELTYLVSEDHDAIVLEDYLREGDGDEISFLRVAENAATALASIHAHKIVHRDIKPANMLVNPDTLAVWYIDFGISVQITRGFEVWQESVEGTLEYLSPEQTGRVNKAIDYRSDIYSLGIVFYRMVTGGMPFTGRSAMELIHAHIATTPVPPIELVPVQSIVSTGIMKMLEKKPEDRYQTAESLTYDIQRCRQLLEAGEDCNAFRVAEKDIFYNLEPGRKLYGKLDALEDLKHVFGNISDHYAQVVLLDGTDAVGKTMILSELDWYATRRNSLVFRADDARAGRGEQYHALQAAFAHFDSLVYGSKVSMTAYRDAILEKLGGNAQALIDILPRLEDILGKQPPVPKLDPAGTQRRAEQVFRMFMRVICDVPCPCVFLFDDAQWLDEATLRLLFSALEDHNLGNCMVVFSFRDDDYETSKRLGRYMDAYNVRHHDVVSLHIQPLRQEEITGILMDTFPQDEQSARELATHVLAYSQGSMRKVELYLKELYHSGVIYEEAGTGKWLWKRDAIDPSAFRDLREQVAALYRALSPEATDCVNRLAALGAEATRGQVETIFEGDMALVDVLRAIEPLRGKNLFVYDAERGVFRFDGSYTRRIFYDMMPEAEQARLHGLIWRRLYKRYEDNEAGLLRNVALITDQFLLAGEGSATERDRLRVMRLNRMAGDEATQASNMEKAAGFYARALPLLGDDPLVLYYSEALGLYLAYAACQFALGETKAATAMYQTVIAHARNEDDRYEAYRQLVNQYLSVADWIRAEAYARAYLASSPLMPDSSDDMAAQIAREKERFLAHEAERGIEHFLHAEESSDPVVLRQGSMLAILTETLVVNVDANSRYYIYKALNYAYENGVYPDFTRVLAMYAEREANRDAHARAKHIFDCGVAYAEKHGAPQGVLWAVYCAVIVHWAEPISHIPAVYQHAKHIAMLEGSLYYGTFADLMLLQYNFFTGVSMNRAARDVEAAIYNADKASFTSFRFVFATVFRQFIRCMTGKTKGMDSFDDRLFNEAEAEDEAETERWLFCAQFYMPYRMQALYTYGYYQEALDYADRLSDYQDGVAQYSAVLTRVVFYHYRALAAIRVCQEDPSRREALAPGIERDIAMMAAFAEAQPENFGMMHRLVLLEYRRAGEIEMETIDEYSALDEGLRAMNQLWDRGIIEEGLMEYWGRKGVAQYRDVHSRNALEIYRELGARLKVLQYSGAENGLERYDSPTISTTTILTSTGLSMTTDTAYSASLDYQAILNVLSYLANESELDELMQRLLALLLENGGADQALLFLLEGEALSLHAFRYSDRHTQGLMSSDLPIALDHLAGDVVPHKVIELAADRRATLVANAAENEYVFLGDAYLEAHQPESFICLPILARGTLLGVIYLENTRLPGVFPPQRESFLNTIVLQASLLLQNALDMENLEGYTMDLEKRLTSYIGQLNTLIAGIAHEINSPLGVCVTVATRLLERTREVTGIFGAGGLSRSAFEEYLGESGDGLDILTNNITRASDLVQNFKRISVNQSNEVFEELDLMPTLRSITEYIRPAVKRVIESCEVTGPPSLMFYTSTGVLAQIFTNLIMNSSIHAFAGMDKQDCLVTIDVSEDEEAVHIIYADNGRGMTAEEKEKVFMPFYTTRRSEGGSGLGGHIILTLVTQTLRGSIHCVSTPGRGTSFIMRLPKELGENKEGTRHA